MQELPETQKTALLLREIDALSYEQIAEAMETTIPSVKSLLVRARVSLAEAAEARQLTCEEVREELGEVAEGLRRSTAPVRRHIRTLRALPGLQGAAAQHEQGARRRLPRRAAAALQEVPARAVRHDRVGRRRQRRRRRGRERRRDGGTSVMSAGISTIATKTAAGLAAAAIVTAGAVEVKHVQTKVPEPGRRRGAARSPRRRRPRRAEPEVVASAQQPVEAPKPVTAARRRRAAPSPSRPRPRLRPTRRPRRPCPTRAAVAEPPRGDDDAAPRRRRRPRPIPAWPRSRRRATARRSTGAPGPPEQTGGVAAPAEPATPPGTPTPVAPPAATTARPAAGTRARPEPADDVDARSSTDASGTGGAPARVARLRIRRDRAATGKDVLRDRVAGSLKRR